MTITLMIITLTLLPSGMVSKLEQEITGYNLLSDCEAERDKVIFHYEHNNPNKNTKLISTGCREQGRL